MIGLLIFAAFYIFLHIWNQDLVTWKTQDDAFGLLSIKIATYQCWMLGKHALNGMEADQLEFTRQLITLELPVSFGRKYLVQGTSRLSGLE